MCLQNGCLVSRILRAVHLELMKAGYPPNGLAYYETLDQWMAFGKTEPFIQLVADAVLKGFKPYQFVSEI